MIINRTGLTAALVTGITLLTAVSSFPVFAQNSSKQEVKITSNQLKENEYKKHKEVDRQLKIALHDLQEAREALKKADHDSHGYRVKAIQETNEAIKDTQLAIQKDR